MQVVPQGTASFLKEYLQSSSQTSFILKVHQCYTEILNRAFPIHWHHISMYNTWMSLELVS